MVMQRVFLQLKAMKIPARYNSTVKIVYIPENMSDKFPTTTALIMHVFHDDRFY